MVYLDLQPMEARGGQYLQHACHEYRHPIITDQVTGEMSPDGGERKIWKYLETYLHQSCHFSPFVISAGGLHGVETKSMLKFPTSRLATSGSNPNLRHADKSRVGSQ